MKTIFKPWAMGTSRYFVLNFIFMFLGCLLVDLITYLARREYDILQSLGVAGIGATVVTIIYYFRK